MKKEKKREKTIFHNLMIEKEKKKRETKERKGRKEWESVGFPHFMDEKRKMKNKEMK